jgi:signal transduction histidine kinase
MNATAPFASGTILNQEFPNSNPTPLRVLLVEDNSADADLVLNELRKSDFTVTHDVIQTADEFRQQVKKMCPDIVLADYNLGQWRGTEALEILREEGLDIPLILISGALGDATAVACIKQGVTDYVLKDSLARLPVAVRSALKDKELREDRRHAEEELAQKVEELAQKVEELARSNRDLEQFAHVASHDLQEPLRMVVAYSQLLAERYRGKLDADADKYVNYAVEGATRMQSLILDLLAFSRAGRQETESRSTDCNKVVATAIKNLQTAILESKAVIKYGRLPSVMANRSQLQHVFQNLIENAIKFRSSESLVVEISAKKQGTAWMLSVADNGIGILAEYAKSIFIIFQRLHARTEYPGNGIGLTICKKIIERYGGEIEALPNEGRGTIFRFTLPAASPAEAQESG